MPSADAKQLADHLADNLRGLRDSRGLTQADVAKLAELPRATYANLESGGANPTLTVLAQIAAALHVRIDELLAPPKSHGKLFKAADLQSHSRGGVTVRKLLPDPLPGLELERMELPPGARMKGMGHTPGTREYLTCESGSVQLALAGAQWTLQPGDVFVFRGDQRHSYFNPGKTTAIAYAAVLL